MITRLLMIALVFCSASVAKARGVPWTFQRLVDDADCIVIAYPKSKQECQIDLSVDPLWKLVLNHPASRTEIEKKVAGMCVRLGIEAVLKGDPKLESLTAKYVTSGTHVLSMIDGPALIDFEIPSGDAPGGRRFAQRYLVFLKRGENDMYEPVSGYFDPGYSFRPISSNPPPPPGFIEVPVH
jgi:hypothetical protein